MNENNVKKNISKNLVKFRTGSGLTQSQLAEKINYSDKSVSKWERGEGFPDIFVLCKLAEFYGISVDDFLKERSESIQPDKPQIQKKRHLIINLLSVGIVWLVAVTTFFLLNLILSLMKINTETVVITFIYAVPVSGIVQTVFSEIWWGKLSSLIAVSVIIWGTVASIYTTFIFYGLKFPQSYTIFFISAVLQVLAVLWFFLRKLKQKQHMNK